MYFFIFASPFNDDLSSEFLKRWIPITLDHQQLPIHKIIRAEVLH